MQSRPHAAVQQPVSPPAPQRSTSLLRGVARHRASGLWEARVWVPDLPLLHLGLHSDEGTAAAAHDLASLKLRPHGFTNFAPARYQVLAQLLLRSSCTEWVLFVRSSAAWRELLQLQGLPEQEELWRPHLVPSADVALLLPDAAAWL